MNLLIRGSLIVFFSATSALAGSFEMTVKSSPNKEIKEGSKIQVEGSSVSVLGSGAAKRKGQAYLIGQASGLPKSTKIEGHVKQPEVANSTSGTIHVTKAF